MEKLNEFQATGKWPGMKSKVVENQAWSEKQDKKARRVERKRKKELKKEVEEPSVNDTDDDEDNLEEDYRLLKKMKKVRHITVCSKKF